MSPVGTIYALTMARTLRQTRRVPTRLLVLTGRLFVSGSLAVSGCSSLTSERGDDIGMAPSNAEASTTTTLPPTPEAMSIAERTAMTEPARRQFFSTAPEVVDKATFGISCDLLAEVSLLGCYHQDPVDAESADLAVADR